MSGTTFWSYWRKAETELRHDEEGGPAGPGLVLLRATAYVSAEEGRTHKEIAASLVEIGASSEQAQEMAERSVESRQREERGHQERAAQEEHQRSQESAAKGERQRALDAFLKELQTGEDAAPKRRITPNG
jgi:hypothetical protein